MKEIKELERALKDKTLTKQEIKRIRAILLRKKGYKHKEILDILPDIKRNALKEWITKYNHTGRNGLRTKYPEKPHAAKLSNKQKEKIKKIITKQTPEEEGVGKQDYWDVSTLRKLVKKRYQVEYKSYSSYTRLFKYCGFSYQRVEFQDTRRDQEAVDEFKKRFEGKLKKGGNIVMSW